MTRNRRSSTRPGATCSDRPANARSRSHGRARNLGSGGGSGGDIHDRPPRRGGHIGAVAIGVTLALLVAGCASSGKGATSGSTSSGAPTTITARPGPGQLGGPYTAASTDSAIKALAAGGVATVSDVSSRSPLVPVHGTIYLTVTRFQARNMALEAADAGGTAGAKVDRLHAMPKGSPPFSYFLAAWITTGRGAGARAIRAAMGTHDWTHAPGVLYPTIALTLFTADVAAHAQSGSGSTAGAAGTGQSSSLLGEVAGLAGSALAHLVGRSGATETRAPIVARDALSAPCSAISGFVDDVLATVFEALKLGDLPGTSTAEQIGNFFISLYNAAVSLAQTVISGLVSAITAPVVGTIQLIAGGLAVATQIVSALQTWQIKVTPSPANNAFAVDPAAGNPGTYDAKVDTGLGDDDYPAALKDCAASVGAPLPSLVGAGSKAAWALQQSTADLVTATSPTDTSLDAAGKTTLAYKTGTESQDVAQNGAATIGFANGTVTVTRPDSDQLKGFVSNLLLAPLPKLVAPAVASILSPLLDAITSQLDLLSSVSNGAVIGVTYHKAPEPKTTDSGSACATSSSGGVTAVSAGHYTGTYTDQVTSQYVSNPNATGGGSGPFTGTLDLTVSPTGAVTGTFTFAGSFVVNVSTKGGGTGTGTATFGVTNPTATGTPQAISLTGLFAASGTVHASVQGISVDVPFGSEAPPFTATMTLTPTPQSACGDIGGTVSGPQPAAEQSAAGLAISGTGTWTAHKVG